MHRISHRRNITNDIPEPLKIFIQKRHDQLLTESDGESIPLIVLVNPGDDITGPDFSFVSENGLLGEGVIQSSQYYRPYQWCSYWSDLGVYEVLLLNDPDNGYWILIPDSVVEAHPDFKWVLTDPSHGGLSDPQPLF